MKKILYLLMFCCMASFAQAREWKAYMAYHDATANYAVGDRIYTLANGSVYTYEPQTNLIHGFSKVSGMSGCEISQMVYNEDEEVFLLVYSDYNFDVLGINDSITNMPEYKNSNVENKTIYNVTMNDHYAYVGTQSGVMVLNLRKREFCNIYSFGVPVHSCVGFNGKILAITANGIYQGNMSSNLLDASKWRKLNSYLLDRFMVIAGKLYACAGDGLYSINPETGDIAKVLRGNFTCYQGNSEGAVFGNSSSIVVMDEKGKFTTTNYQNDFRCISLNTDGTLWAARGNNGLQGFKFENNSLTPVSDAIVPNSPIRNFTYYLTYTPDNRLLIGGGSLNYNNKNYAGTVMAYENGRWINFDEDSIYQKTKTPFLNVTSVIEDPNDKSHHYVSAAGGGLYEYRNAHFVNLYSYDNSPLQTILPNDAIPRMYVRTAGLTYDKEGNLWILNNQVDSILKIRMANGSWKSFYFKDLAGYPTFDKILLDSRGWAWITHRRSTSVHHAGVLGFYTGGTLGNTSDDTWKFHYKFTNQDNTQYTFNTLYDVAEDRDGAIWIATDKGPFVLNNPASFFENSPVFTQVKVPRNDGTNYADYLLSGECITCIAIDGGNRKWFGTSSNGVYLISADGLETIHHFTADNSPLLSNVIYSIAINKSTGEVMIGTDAGLISYKGDATEPQTQMDKNNLHIYPNPVRPEFEGNIRIDGLCFNSDVKIATASGRVIAQGKSVGGMFTWNLKDGSGKRVSTGVYYIVGSDEDGKNGIIGKFVVI